MNDSPSHILVVDDEEDVLSVLLDLIRADGYNATGTANPEEALELVKDEVIDLVIVDLMMPKMSGWNLLKSLKSYDQALPVIVITGYITEQSESILTSQQADGYLIKPVDHQRLHNQLQALLSPTTPQIPATIAVVDDEFDTRRIVDHVFSRRGFTVAQYETVASALEAIQTDPPNLIILDLAFPHEDGFDLCRSLQNTPAADIPVLILTAHASRENLMHAIRLGVRGFIAKPFAPNALADRAAKVLRHG